jgi:hypothetical protein
MLKTPLFAVCALVVGTSYIASAQTSSPPAITVNGAAPDTAMPQGNTPDTPPIDDKDIYCPTALEPILPGDYYACEARAAYGRESYGKIADLLEEAAYWANKDAQYTLGLAYFNGDTPKIAQNRPLGLAWLALAAERKNEQYVLAYAQARVKATPAELHQAQALWHKMRLKYGDQVAAKRAIERFNHNIQPIDDAARENGIAYLHGFSPYPESAFTIANKLHDQATTDFENIHGSVVVGKPEWVQNKPAGAASTASPSALNLSLGANNAQP